MELTSYNLFNFALKRYKQKEYKNIQKQRFKFVKTIEEKSPKKEEKKINYKEIINYFHALLINSSNISNIIFNSFNPLIEECFNNLEFLSITDNYLRNIDFIVCLPNLFFLDLFGNPIEDFTALQTNNIFGYLRLSVEIYNEEKILSIHGLKCGILDIDLKDKNKIKIFSNNNHDICMINNEINLIIDRIKYEENKSRLHTRKKTKRIEVSQISHRSNSNVDLIKEQKKNKISPIKTKNKENEDMVVRKSDYIKKIKNPLLLKIKQYFDDYQSAMDKNIQNENSSSQNNNKNKEKNIPINNRLFSSQYLENDKIYLQHEKDKLTLIFEIYKKISIFNREKNDNKYYVGNLHYINVNNHTDNILVTEIKDSIMKHSQIPRSSIIILISILFYTIGAISEKMINIIINHILIKYYNYIENEPLPDFSNLGNIHYLTFYYSTYDYIYKRMIDNEQNISIEKYKKLLKILKMEKLILKSNYLYRKSKYNKSKSNTSIFHEYKKINIENEISSIKELNITKEFLVLIEFLCDYIIYETIEDLVIVNSYPGEYSYLIELKEKLEENAFHKEFRLNKNNFLVRPSLSALKFQKSKIERIYNKHYFQKYKVNQDNEKQAVREVKSSTLHSFKGNMGNNILMNGTNCFIFNDEYNKSDDIDLDDCLYIESITRNSKNKLIRRKKNISPFNLKHRVNNSSYEDEKNSQIKSLSIYKSRNNGEFELLKKMIFNREILSQHARKVLKFEKQKKILSKYANLHMRNYQRNQLKKKFVDAAGIKIEESKPIGNAGGSLSTNLENNNTTKNNINLEMNNDSNSLPHYKKILNSPNSTKYMRNTFKTPNNYKRNLKKIINSINNNIMNSKNIELKDKSSFISERKCSRPNHIYKSPFHEVPESYPGITLLKFGLNKSKKELKTIKAFNKRNTNHKIRKNVKVNTCNVLTKIIKKNIKINMLRNMRRPTALKSQANSQ